MRDAVNADSLSIEIGGSKVVEDISFTMESGTIWLVRGDCGTGKTTLAKVLVGLIPELYGGYKVEGRVEVFGYRPTEALRRGMTAYVPQDVSLATITASAAEELAAYGLERRIPELKRLVGDVAFREIRTLSAGERFKVLIGLSVLLDKKLLVIDEPSGYLDSDSLEEALDVLEEFVSRYGSVVLLVEHRSDRYAGRVSGIIDLGSKTACSVSELEERPPGGTILEVSDLSFSYSGLRVLEGVDLRVESGSVVAITGPNGSGKTTLLKLALGLLKPRGGVVRRRYRRALYLPQVSSYWMGGDLDSALRATGCGPGVVTLAGVSGGNAASLSLGEVRRLSVYAGIYGESDLVVVDEVSLGLDGASVACLKEAFERAREAGKSVLFSTHDEDMVGLLEADTVVELPWR